MKQVIAYDGVQWPDRPSTTIRLPEPTYHERPTKHTGRAPAIFAHSVLALSVVIGVACLFVGGPIITFFTFWWWSDEMTDIGLKRKALAIWDEASTRGEDPDLAVRKFYYQRSYGQSFGNEAADRMAEETTQRLNQPRSQAA